uniref:Bcl-2-like protein 1 n=2 Tax=Lepisosteus oculatus TaxID=7918 RepID=W5MG74_LEPOC
KMSYSNRDLVVYYINYKLSQKNYSWDQFSLEGRTGGAEAVGSGSPNAEERTNGAANGGGGPVSRQPPQGIEAVQGALRDSANEFELRYGRAFSDLSSQLHITPATAYQSFEHVMDEVFRDGVNWGRIVGLFAFGGALCVECVEKEMSNLVSRIAEWMTVYLDNNIQPWIQSQGGWDRFAEIFGKDAAAEYRRSQESFKKWLLAGMTLVTGLVVGSYIAKKRL